MRSMTRDECMAALRLHPREAVVLATVAHVQEVALTRCTDDTLASVVWALDSARRWALGEAERDECRAAADAVYYAYATDAVYYAAYAADAAHNVAYAAYAATDTSVYAADAAYAAEAGAAADTAESRAKLVARLGMPRAWGPPVRLVRGGIEVIVAGEYVWTCPEGTLEYVEGRPTEGAAAVLYDECKEAA